MFLAITRYGGFYFSESHSREVKSKWILLQNVYYVKKKISIAKYNTARLRSKHVILLEESDIPINKKKPWITYNKVIDLIKGKEHFQKTKKELTKWRLDK